MLYDDSTTKIEATYEVAAAAPNGVPEGVLRADDYMMVGGIEIVPLSKLIGEIHMKGREFEDEAAMHRRRWRRTKRCFACRPAAEYAPHIRLCKEIAR